MRAEQLSLLASVERVEKPWKRQRATSRAQHRRQRAIDVEKQVTGHGETRAAQVLRILDAFWNARQYSPTALELLEWGRERGERLFDVNSIRPRLHALVEKGLVTPGAKRKCRISGVIVHTWHSREAGSQEPR